MAYSGWVGKRLGFVVLTIAAVLVTLLPSPARAALVVPEFQQTRHWVRAESGSHPRFVDDLGRTVILRGVNVNGLGEYYQEYKDLPSTLPLTRDDFREISSYGFNVVRLIVSWSRLEPRPGVIDRAYLERVAQTIEDARVHDIYVLIDMHQDAWGQGVQTPDGFTCPSPSTPSVAFDGAPRWATSQLGGLGTCQVQSRDIAPAVELSFSRLYANAGGLQDHFLSVWRAVAGRFRGASNVVGYDILNEPDPGITPGVNDYTLLGTFYRRAIAAIRSVDSRHTIFFEPSVLFRPLATPGPLPMPGFTRDKNLAYAPHLYNESIDVIPGTIEDGFTNARRAAKYYGGRPIFSGEWGWFGNPATDQPKIVRYAVAEDDAMISGTWWQWKQACGDPHAARRGGPKPSCAGKSLYSDGLVTRSDANKAVLARAYVRAAPGRLASMSVIGRNGGLIARGVSDRRDGRATIWFSSRSCHGYPHVDGVNARVLYVGSQEFGYRVEVTVPRQGDYTIRLTCGAYPAVNPG